MTEEKKYEGGRIESTGETIINDEYGLPVDVKEDTTSDYPVYSDSLPNYIRPYCLGFRELDIGASVVRTWSAQPDIIFRPLGLMVWGCKNESRILGLKTHNRMHMLASGDAIPLRFFEPGFSFKEFADSVERGVISDPRMDEAWTFFRGLIDKKPDVPARQLFKFDTLTPADRIEIETKGPLAVMVLWGLGATI